MSDTVPHCRLLLADVAPAVRDGSTSIGWQVWNDGDEPVVIRGAAAPDPQCFSPATAAALEIGARTSEHLEVRFVLGRREIGAEFQGARLIVDVDVDVDGTPWRVIATLEGRFGQMVIVRLVERRRRCTGRHAPREHREAGAPARPEGSLFLEPWCDVPILGTARRHRTENGRPLSAAVRGKLRASAGYAARGSRTNTGITRVVFRSYSANPGIFAACRSKRRRRS